MKKKATLSYLFLGIFVLGVLTSCQKETSGDVDPALFGKWKVIRATAKLQLLSYSDSTSYQGTGDDHFTFTTDYKWHSHFQNDDESSPFTLSGDTIILTNRDEFPNRMQIKLLTANQLTLCAKEKIDNFPFPQCYQEMTVHLEKINQ